MSRKPLRALSPAETEILRLVWQLAEATVQQVHEHLPSGRDIAMVTVQTLLRRLEQKGYVKHYSEGKAHVFYPTAKREAVIQRSVADFLNRLFAGDPVPLMHHLAEHGQLSLEDIERLKKLIEQK